jgi:hypothetical protein
LGHPDGQLLLLCYAGQPASIHFLKSEMRSGGQGASGGMCPVDT